MDIIPTGGETRAGHAGVHAFCNLVTDMMERARALRSGILL